MWLDSYFLLLILWVTLFFTSEASAQRSLYGEPCSSTRRCDRRAFLGCSNGTCECIKHEEMIYEPHAAKCAVKVGEQCKFTMKDMDGHTAIDQYACVEHAVCGEDAFCSCNDNFFENSNGTCSPRAGNGQLCSEEIKCSNNVGLSCISGSCNCQENSEYSTKLQRCVGLVDRPCISNDCTENAVCKENKCKCDGYFYKSSDEKCLRRQGHLGNCSSDQECADENGQELRCMDGKCTCDPENSVFGTARKNGNSCFLRFYGFEQSEFTQCLGKPGRPCINGLCAPGTFCAYHSCSYDYGICACLPGYAMSQLNNCKIPHNQPCGSSGDCIDGLVCGEKCRCRYASQQFSSDLMQCISPVGLPCNDLIGCSYGAECVKIRNTTNGRCQCKEEFLESAGGICRLKFGIKCEFSSACDNNSGLDCIEGICQCNDFQEYSSSLKKCLGLIGAPCNHKMSSKHQCVENSKCVKIADEPVDGRCTCSEGFAINADYNCEAVAPASKED